MDYEDFRARAQHGTRAQFLMGAVSEARQRRPGMRLLIGLAITVAFVGTAEAAT